MRKHLFAPCPAVSRTMSDYILLLAFGALAFAGSLRAGQNADPKIVAQTVPAGPRIWLAEGQALLVQHAGATAGEQVLAQSVAAGNAMPLALAKGDFDGDGYEDLVVGYATPAGGAIVLHRGNPDAFAPQSDASFRAIGHGEFPSPFLPEARVFSVPILGGIGSALQLNKGCYGREYEEQDFCANQFHVLSHRRHAGLGPLSALSRTSWQPPPFPRPDSHK